MRTDGQWALVLRRGPYALLALGTALGLLTSSLFGAGPGRLTAIGVLAVAAAGLHYACVDRRWDGGHLDDGVGTLYLVTRTLLAFALTWLNPFFAVFAVAGYFDFHVYVSKKWSRAALLATAVTMAGSQSGGLPPRTWTQGIAFAALFGLNAGLTLLFTRIADHEDVVAAERDATIAELERSNAALEAAMAENAALQERLVVQAREAGVRDERERLAVEIHDTIAQGLTGVVTQLQAADQAAGPDAAATHRGRAAELARVALREARRSVQGLLPAQLDDADLGLALKRLVRDWGEAQGVAAELTVTGEPAPLHPEVSATVLRVAQESLANVAKHADAGRVGVTLSFMDGELTLDVRDDGRGFDPAAVSPTDASGGAGLRGMRRRATRLAGDLILESEPGSGTAISLHVPSSRDSSREVEGTRSLARRAPGTFIPLDGQEEGRE